MDKTRTEYIDPSGMVTDAAGNYRKQKRPLVSKPRPEGKFGQNAPFGTDPVNPAATHSRFTTSATSVGGNKKDRIVPYAVIESFTSSIPASTTAIVPSGVQAAGQRPKIPVGKR